MLSNQINGSQEIKKQNRFSVNYNDEEFILILSKNNDNIDFQFYSLMTPQFKYKGSFNYDKLNKENQLFKILNNINEGYTLISECINSKLYCLKEENEGFLFSILSMLPGIKNVDFILNKDFSPEEEIIYLQNLEQQKYIKSLNEEILKLKEINLKNDNEIMELKKIIEEDNKLEEELNEKILKKLNEENIKTQGMIDKLFNQDNNIFDYLRNIKNTLRGFSLEKKFLYYESKENWMKLYKGLTIGILPNKNIIFGSSKKLTIIDWNSKEKIITVPNAHLHSISYISIIDNENFISCSEDKLIKKWNIDYNKKKLNLIDTLQGHNKAINKIIYLKEKEIIISCSNDKTIKIWEKKNNEYKCIRTLEHENPIKSIIKFNYDTLISGDFYGCVKFWNLNDFQEIFSIQKAEVCWSEALKKIDDDRIIVGGRLDKKFKIISFIERKIIKEFLSNVIVYSIHLFKNGIVGLCGGKPYIIELRDNIEFNIIQIIHTDYAKCINIIIELDNGDFLSANDEKRIKLFRSNY